MPTDHGNEKRLRDAGLITTDDVPPAYKEVFEGLTAEEVKVILDVKERLDKAGGESRRHPGTVGILP